MITAQPDHFSTAPLEPRLNSGEVHLWRAELDDSPEYTAVLSSEELLRAGRFHFERDRRRFTASHGLLRMILSGYTGIAPDELGFTVGAYGKPMLAPNFHGLEFNLSHSGDLMLLAVSRQREVGVDLELVRDNVPFESLATHYFSPSEAWDIRTAPLAERAARFYAMWTTTEARLKAAGTGLHHGTTVLQPDRWSLLTLTPEEGYAAALAVGGGDDFQLQCWSWQS